MEWYEKPARMMIRYYTGYWDKIKDKDLEKLAKEKKEKWHINCEWIEGTPSVADKTGSPKTNTTLFQAEGFKKFSPLQDFDFLREYLPYAHKYGIKLIAYLNMHWYSYEFAEEHPDWEQITSNGQAYGKIHPLYGNGTTFCVNSSWRDWAFKLIKEAMKTGIDGVHLDGPVIYPDCCYCSSCQKKFKEKFGQEIPKEDWQNPLWKEFLEFREDSMANFLKDAQKVVKEINPKGVIFLNGGNWMQPWSVARDAEKLSKFQNFSAAEFYFHCYKGEHNLYSTTISSKFLTSTGIPGLQFTHYAMGSWHYLYLNQAEIRLALSQAFACGAGTWLGTCFPSAENDPEGYKPVKRIFGFVEENEEYFLNSKSAAQVALLFSSQTSHYYISTFSELYRDLGTGKEENLIRDSGTGKLTVDWSKRKRFCDEFHKDSRIGYFYTLSRQHIPFDIILDSFLTKENLKKYKVLILPDAACLSDNQIKIIKEFVRQGGNLLASFEAGFYDERGNEKKERIFDLLGVKEIEGLFPAYRGENYIIFKEDALSFKKGERIERAPYVFKVKPKKEIKIPAFFLKPLPRIYVPLKEESKYPAIIINQFGRGKVIYFTYPIGNFYGVDKLVNQERLIGEAIKVLTPQQIVEIEAPKTVQMEVFKQRERLIIHLVNNTGDMQRPIGDFIPIFKLKLKVDKENIKRVISLRDKKELEKVNDSYVLPKLIDYDILVVE